MGNIAGTEIARAEGLSNKELKSKSKLDTEYSQLDSQIWDTTFLSAMKEINDYEVPGAITSSAPVGKINAAELSAVFLQDRDSASIENLKSEIQKQIAHIAGQVEDNANKNITRRLQSIYRIHEAMVRQDEREKRHLAAMVKAEEAKSKKKSKKELPVYLKVSIKFVIGSLLRMFKSTGKHDPEIYRELVDLATEILSELPPLSLEIEDESIASSIEQVGHFFGQILKGDVPGVSESDQIASLSPLLGLALAKGNLTSALSISQRFLTLENSDEFQTTMTQLKPMLKKLNQIKGPGGKAAFMSWNPEKLGPDMVLSNDNLTVTRSNSSGWGTQLSEQTYTEGVHYIEFTVDRNDSSCICLGIASSTFSNLNQKSSWNNCWSLQGDSDMYCNGNNDGSLFDYSQGDRIGMLINMEEHNLTYFKNDTKQTKSPFSFAGAEEVHILACFGGSNQLVTINNEPDIPEEAQEQITTLAPKPTIVEEEKKDDEKEEEHKEEIPKNLSNILKNQVFDCINEETGQVTPIVASIWVLVCLSKMSEDYFSPFNLNEKSAPEVDTKAKILKKLGLSVDVQAATFNDLYGILSNVVEIYANKQWDKMDAPLCRWAIVTSMKILKGHLFTVKHLGIEESVSGLTSELKGNIYNLITKLVETEDDSPSHEVILNEASLTLIHSFQIFYADREQMLEFLGERIAEAKSGQELSKSKKDLYDMLLLKLMSPSNLSRALAVEDETGATKISSILDNVLDLVQAESAKKLKNQANEEAKEEAKQEASSPWVKFLSSAQKIVFSQANRVAYTGHWLNILQNYVIKALNISTSLINQIDGDSVVEGTLLDSVLPNLILALNLIKFSLPLVTSLVEPVLSFSALLKNLKVDEGSKKKSTTKVQEVVESEHPYSGASNMTKKVAIEGATSYKLKFDSQCNSESTYDYLDLFLDEEKSNKHSRWEGTNWPTEELVVENPILVFQFVSDDSNSFWGYKIEIETEVEREVSQSGWVLNLREGINYLITILNKTMIECKFETDAVDTPELKNPLLRFGIQDKALWLICPDEKRDIPEDLVSIAMFTPSSASKDMAIPTLGKAMSTVDGMNTSFGRQISRFMHATSSSTNLSTYLMGYSTSSRSFAKYSDIPIIEELIDGSERVIQGMEQFKKSSDIVGPMAKLGGSDLDQAERALLAVYVFAFDETEQLSYLLDNPTTISSAMCKLVKQVSTIRKWTQEEKQRRLDSGDEEVTAASIGNEIVKKCVLLLHSHLQRAISEMEIKSIFTSAPTLKRSASEEGKAIATLKPTSKWHTVKKQIGTLSKLRTLSQMRPKAVEPEESSEDSELSRLAKTIMEFVGGEKSAEQMVKQLHHRRILGICRSIGLNFLLNTLKSNVAETKSIRGLVINVFSQGFTVGGKKVHYTDEIEGIDPNLTSCVQQGFFAIYQFLLNRLNISIVSELDCTSSDIAKSFLTTFEALSYPFESVDTHKLLDLNLHESTAFLLSWSKGLYINEQIPMKFVDSTCITDFKVHKEDDFVNDGNKTVVSLNTTNRLAGDLDEDSEDTQTKLCLELQKNTGKPIVEIKLLAEEDATPEGWERLEQAANESGPARYLAFQRADPAPSMNFLTGLVIKTNDPLTIQGTFTAYNNLLEQNQTAEEKEGRNDRRDKLKVSSWNLFKLLVYACVGKADDKAITGASESKQIVLQEVFVEQIFKELAWAQPKEKLITDARVYTNMRLSKVNSGVLWLGKSTSTKESSQNPVTIWLQAFRAEIQADKVNWMSIDEEETFEEDELSQMIDSYVTRFDPGQKGVLNTEDIEKFDEETKKALLEDLPVEIKNDKDQVDFFRFLLYIRDSAVEDFTENVKIYLSTSALFASLPTDFATAKARLDVSPSDVISELSGSLSETNTFRKYLDWVNDLGDQKQIGIIDSEKFKEEMPKEFLNSKGDFDLFIAINYVKYHPEDKRFEDFQPFTKDYNILGSCEEIYSKFSKKTSSPDYVASLLWVINQCCISSSLLKVLSAPALMSELIKHMLYGASEVIQVTAFRIVRRIVAGHHSPQSISKVWSSIPKEPLLQYVPLSATNDIVQTMLGLIGLQSNFYIRQDLVLSQSKIGVISYEASEFLRSLLQNERWQGEVIGIIETAIQEVAERVSEASIDMEVGFGALYFLTLASSHVSNARFAQEWAKVSLQNASIGEGYIVKILEETKMAKIFNEDDEMTHKESLDKIIEGVSSFKVSLFQSLDLAQHNRLLTGMTSIAKTLHELKPKTENVDTVQTQLTIYTILKQFVYTITDSLIRCDYAVPADLILEISRLVKPTKNFDMKAKYLYTFIRQTLYSKNRDQAIELRKAQGHLTFETSTAEESKDQPEISEKEQSKILENMEEDLQIVMACALSAGYSFTACYAAIQAGNHDFDSVVSHVTDALEEQKKQQVETRATGGSAWLYKLAKSEDFEFSVEDSSSRGSYQQNEKGHLVIELHDALDETKSIYFETSSKIYKATKHICPEITIFATIGSSVKESTFGFYVGPFSFKVINGNINIGNEHLAEVNHTTLSIKMSVKFTGEITISDEDGKLFDKSLTCEGVYDGLKLGKIGVFLEACDTLPVNVSLKGCAIYSGTMAQKISYWTELEDEAEKKEEETKKEVKVGVKQQNMTEARLGLTGAPADLASSIYSTTPSFDKALTQLLKDTTAYEGCVELPEEITISEIAIVDKADSIDSESQMVKVYENGVEKGLWTDYISDKILTIKKEKTPKTVLSAIEFNLEEEKKNYTELGNINDVKIHTSMEVRAQMGKRLALKDIILLKVDNPQIVVLPIGYDLWLDDEKAFNFAKKEDSYYLFLARRQNEYMLNWPINKLSSSTTSSGAFGLVDSFEATGDQPDEFDPKNIEEELANLGKTTIPELLYLLNTYENQAVQIARKQLFMSLLRKQPGKLLDIVNDKSIFFLMQCLENDLDILTKPFQNILEGSNGSQLASKLFEECVFQLIMEATKQSGNSSMREHIIESPHPYENNMNVNETIHLRGADSLHIVFDPECVTEESCDVIRFYSQPGNQNQIVEYSGRGFAPIDVPGDIVYFNYTTDSSCVEWGYRITVYPIGGNKKKAGVDPLVKKCNIKHAMWILDFVLGYNAIPAALENFSSKYIINPLSVFMYKTEEPERQKKLLSTIQQLITRPHAVTPVMRSLAEALVTETKDLYSLERPSKSASGLLQSLINLVVEVRDKYGIHINEKWFVDISEVYNMMVGLGNRSEELLPSLFEQFKSNRGITNEISRESAHPYNKQISTKEIYCKGADYIDIKFEQECKTDACDTILFTYDKSRLQEAGGTEGMGASKGVWSNSPTGPDIVLSNDDRTVTRTSSGGWGNAVWNQTLSKCKIKITFKIEDAQSSCLYIGIIAANDSPDLTQCWYQDANTDLWTWNRDGAMHQRGSSMNPSNAAYVSGDEISFLIDLFEKTCTCFKGDVEVHKFENIAEEVMPCVSNGGSHNVVTIQSVESSGGGSLSGKQLTIKGDRVFYHFPINSGYLQRNSNRWVKDTADWVIIGNEETRVRRKGEKEGPSTHYSTNMIDKGRHYYEVRFARIAEDKRVQIGFAPANVAKEEYLVHDNSACLQNNGLAFINCAEKNTEQKFGPDDVIGCYLDKDAATVAFYINGSEVLKSNFNIDQSAEYYLIGTLDAPGQEVYMSTKVVPPESIDLIVNSASTGSSKEWGYKFKVSPVYHGLNQLNAVANLNERQQDKWNKYVKRHMEEFTQDVDQELVSFIDEWCLSKTLDPIKMDLEELKPKPEDLVHYPKLEKLHISDIKDRFKFLVYFNKQIEKVLHLLSLDLSQKSAEGVMSIKNAILKCRFAIFYGMKNQKFTDVISSSFADSMPNIKLHRARAILLKNKGRVDVNGTLSVFGQLYQRLKGVPPTSLRARERIFCTEFVGEGSQDAGGPYNEVMSMICEELQSKYLQLFVPCQNNVHNIGENRDTWIINPAADTAIQKELFFFLGKMMGVAIRTQNNLNFSFPPIFWKKLVMEDPTEADLKGMDECCYQMLEILRNLKGQGIGEEEFKEMFADEMFTTTDSGGRTVELIGDGKNIQVTYENAHDYAEGISKARIAECMDQYALLRKGMTAVIPLQLLSLFTWQQVETKVCGTQDVNIDILMERTKYQGIDKNAKHVGWFWEVLREITPKDRSLFLRFVWGRSRLPQGKSFKKFKLTALGRGGNEDEYLPVSHTCFFQLDLPSYSTKEIMKAKLLYAITHCRAIDIDHVTSETFDDAE